MTFVGAFIVKSESRKLTMFVNDPKGKELAREMGETKMSAKFDVVSGGQHQICIQNGQNSESIKFELTIQTGEFSEDRS